MRVVYTKRASTQACDCKLFSQVKFWARWKEGSARWSRIGRLFPTGDPIAQDSNVPSGSAFFYFPQQTDPD